MSVLDWLERSVLTNCVEAHSCCPQMSCYKAHVLSSFVVLVQLTIAWVTHAVVTSQVIVSSPEQGKSSTAVFWQVLLMSGSAVFAPPHLRHAEANGHAGNRLMVCC